MRSGDPASFHIFQTGECVLHRKNKPKWLIIIEKHSLIMYYYTMNTKYTNDKVKNILEDFSTLQKKCGKHFLQIKKRMQQLKAFSNLSEFMNSGFDNPHLETGDLAGMIGWSVNQNVRLLFQIDEPIDEELFKKMKDIKDITVIGVLDYHGGKKNWIIG